MNAWYDKLKCWKLKCWKSFGCYGDLIILYVSVIRFKGILATKIFRNHQISKWYPLTHKIVPFYSTPHFQSTSIKIFNPVKQ